MTNIIEIEYMTMEDIITSTDQPTNTTRLCKHIFYICDNGVDIAEGNH